MEPVAPPNAQDVQQLVNERVAALGSGLRETTTVEWRGTQLPVPVISMPVALLSYNPGTHRIRAQRSLDAERDRLLESEPYGQPSQAYLHELLRGEPTEVTKVDPDFQALKDDLSEHGQTEPGIITRSGVLINGNTRRAALSELGQANMRVGVLPPDAGLEDIQTVELSLQLRKDFKREYSFMNFLLAIDERVAAGRPATEIQRDFRIRAATFERSRWILAFVQEAIERSRVIGGTGIAVALRLVDFETDQGKLEELHRAYTARKTKSPEDAEALREQRLLAIALHKSKTDLRLIEPNFMELYMKRRVPTVSEGDPPARLKIPGTSLAVAATSPKVEAMRELVTKALRARAVAVSGAAVPPAQALQANNLLGELDAEVDDALNQAGRTARLIKRRVAAADRLSDANEDLEHCLAAIGEARSTGNFVVSELDEPLARLKTNLLRLAYQVNRGNVVEGEGAAWLRAVAAISKPGG